MKKSESTLNSGNACYNSLPNLFSYRLLSKIMNIKSQKTIILPLGWEAMDWIDLAQDRE
jgi:hypothetical protein